MGVLSDVVVVDESQAEAIASMSVPSQELPGADVKGIDTIKLGTLESILTGRPYDDVVNHESINEASEEGPWVFSVSPALVSALASASAEQLSATARAWAATDEFRIQQWPLDAVESVLSELVHVARLAMDEGKRVFLWMSL